MQDNIFSDVERVMSALCEPLGEYAPKRRRLVVDYKDTAGQDINQDLVTWHNREATDDALVQSLKGELEERGCKLSAIAELLEDGKSNILYLAPGYLEETMSEMGLPVPVDMAAALEAQGVRPVNWKELASGPSTSGRKDDCETFRRKSTNGN